MKRIKGFVKTAQDGFFDAYRRRLISRRVSLNYEKSHYKVEVWKYILAFGLITLFMAWGYLPNRDRSVAVNDLFSVSDDVGVNLSKTSTDSDLSTGIALNIAESANLAVAQDVLIAADMNIVKKELGSVSSEVSVAKSVPIFDLASFGRTIKYHQVVQGEDLQSIADKYKVSTNTIRWANGMKTNQVSVGAKLKILPIDGILYKVKTGDNVNQLAAKYKANPQRIQILNDVELRGLVNGEEIIIPEGILPNEERPDYVPPAPAQQTYYRSYFASTGGGGRVDISRLPNRYRATAGNRYAFGNCTWYSFERRKQLGRPIGGMWGNASSWAYSAARNGFAVNKNPAPGAIFQTAAGWGGYGHVGIVESVAPNGDIVVTEMNYGGYNVITQSVIKAQYVKSYNYIH